MNVRVQVCVGERAKRVHTCVFGVYLCACVCVQPCVYEKVCACVYQYVSACVYGRVCVRVCVYGHVCVIMCV